MPWAKLQLVMYGHTPARNLPQSLVLKNILPMDLEGFWEFLDFLAGEPSGAAVAEGNFGVRVKDR